MSPRSSQDAETGVMIPVTADKTYEVRGGVRISFELSQALTPAHTWPSSTPLPRPGKLGASGTPSTRTWFFHRGPRQTRGQTSEGADNGLAEIRQGGAHPGRCGGRCLSRRTEPQSVPLPVEQVNTAMCSGIPESAMAGRITLPAMPITPATADMHSAR